MIGVPDDDGGELPKAFVVPASDDFDGAALTAFVAEQVAPHKRIRAVELVQEIPKSPSGKILRCLLRRGAGAPRDLPGEAYETPAKEGVQLGAGGTLGSRAKRHPAWLPVEMDSSLAATKCVSSQARNVASPRYRAHATFSAA